MLANDKRLARLNIIKDVLGRLHYAGKNKQLTRPGSRKLYSHMTCQILKPVNLRSDYREDVNRGARGKLLNQGGVTDHDALSRFGKSLTNLGKRRS